MFTWELCIAHHETDITEEYNGADNGDDNDVGENETGGESGDTEVQWVPARRGGSAKQERQGCTGDETNGCG